MLDYIVEKIEKKDERVIYLDNKEEIQDFFKFDLRRKINKKDLKWIINISQEVLLGSPKEEIYDKN